MSTLIQADTAAEAAAQWWAEQVGAPVFRNVDAASSPEDRELGGFAGMLGALIADEHPVTDETGRKFVEALTVKIADWLERWDWLSLGVDYGPDPQLAEAADAAGIHLSRFPWKTHMSVHRDYVTASLGYRAPSVLIWATPDWERPQCGEHRYTDDWEPLLKVCGLPRYHTEDHGQWQQDTERCAECGGTYIDHFGRTQHEKRMERGDYHSWTPEGR